MAITVFISYSHQDSAFVDRLKHDLSAGSVSIRNDHERLDPGKPTWEAAIRVEIEFANVVLYVASPAALSSAHVQGELDVAVAYNKKIIPIWASGTEWVHCIPMSMTKMQYIDARDNRYDTGIATLFKSLGLPAVPTPTVVPPPPPATSAHGESLHTRKHHKVFISYRRSDSAAMSGRIYDRLVLQFGRENIFKDVDDIPPGVRFSEYIRQSLSQCLVELVIIGQQWLTARTNDGVRRVDDPQDWVRQEIELGFALGITVLPVLVEGASMPPKVSLPAPLWELPEINAVMVRNDPDFGRDMDRTIAALQDLFAAQPDSVKPWSSRLPPLIRTLAHGCWKVFLFIFVGNYLSFLVLSLMQGGWAAFTDSLTSWGLVAPLEKLNPPVFLLGTGLFVALALVGFIEELAEQRTTQSNKMLE